MKEYRKSNPNKWRQYLSEYQNREKDKIKSYREKHSLRKKHEISDSEWEACKNYFNNSCAYCGLSEDEHKILYNQRLHKEHAINNGANDLSNCVPACKICNGKKWSMDFDDWYIPSNESYSGVRYIKIINWLTDDYIKI